MEKEPIKVPVPAPFTRAPIPPVRRFRDRKNDYKRQPKHPDKGSEAVVTPVIGD